MSVLFAMIAGLLVGGVGGFLLLEGIDMLVMNLLMGIVGGLLGLGIYTIFLSGLESNIGLINWRSLGCSALFALMFVAVFDLMHKFFPKRAANVSGVESKKNLKELDED